MSGEYTDLLAVNDADAARTRPRVAEFRRLCPAVTAEEIAQESERDAAGLTLRLHVDHPGGAA